MTIAETIYQHVKALPPGKALEVLHSELLDCYDQFFRLPGLEVVELDATVVDIATELRANHPNSLRTPDVIQLACAITSSSDQFLTGDKKLADIQEVNLNANISHDLSVGGNGTHRKTSGRGAYPGQDLDFSIDNKQLS